MSLFTFPEILFLEDPPLFSPFCSSDYEVWIAGVGIYFEIDNPWGDLNKNSQPILTKCSVCAWKQNLLPLIFDQWRCKVSKCLAQMADKLWLILKILCSYTESRGKPFTFHVKVHFIIVSFFFALVCFFL